MNRKKKRHIAAVFDLKWPYRRHYGLFSGLQEYARDHANWTFDISSYPEIELAQGRHFDGIIGRITSDCAQAAQEANIPTVNLWMDSPITGSFPEIHPDFREAGRIAAEHLINRGFSKLAYFGFSKHSPKLQYQGMRDVARPKGIEVERHRVSGQWDQNSKGWLRFVAKVEKAIYSWQGPVGITCLTDELARAVATICQKNERIIPDQIAIVGTGNDDLICTAVDPNLSSIAMGYIKCGYEAGRLLDKMMRGDNSHPQIKLSPPRELVLRQSSDGHSVKDPVVKAALVYMQKQHQDHRLSVNDIAQAVGTGRKTLERRFQKQIQRSINIELTRIRISKLKRLLVECDTSVTELSEACGFGNIVSMHSLFKRATGLTPGQFRERQSLNQLD